MKKLLFAGSLLAMSMAWTGCSKEGAGQSSQDQAFADSIAQYMGAVQGADLARSYEMLDSAQKASMSKEAILAGIKTVLLADTADKGYISGVGIGLGLLQQAGYPEQQGGVKLSYKMLFEAFAKSFRADSVPSLSEDRSTLQALMSQVQVRAMEKARAAEEARRAEAADSPEAKQNMQAGQAYADSLMKADAAYKKTDSGLLYKNVAEGKGQQPVSGDMVSVKYTGRHIDGSVFDSSGDKAVDFPVDGVVPGFKEALKLMKKGGKAVIVIPGNLAYGVDGTPDGSIKPNETLVFDIELQDVKKK